MIDLAGGSLTGLKSNTKVQADQKCNVSVCYDSSKSVLHGTCLDIDKFDTHYLLHLLLLVQAPAQIYMPMMIMMA